LVVGDGAPGRFDAPLTRPPLDPPLVVTGGFGEYRIGHFHAGLDLGTGERVGKSVYAPRSGHIERVRASGVGYGRSIYLKTDDGRLLQFGHLDAFAEPMAHYVAAIQESTGQYEQDLWPEPGRFRIRVGQRIAWTGESGAGGPHLHFEIRRGDMAYHPLRAGLWVADKRPPTVASLTLEPLDETSYVERGAAPFTIALGAAPETVVVEGRVRAVVGARDGLWRGVDRMVPWITRMEWGDQWIECRFDSVSWATDMPEGDYVYDAGRVVGEKGIVLWAPPGFRPRVIHSAAPLAEEAGTIRVRPGDPPRALRLSASDVAGNWATRAVVLRAPEPDERGPDTTRAGGADESDPARWFDFAALPDWRLRVTFRGAPRGSRDVRILHQRATEHAGEWSVVLDYAPWRSVPPGVTGKDGNGRPWQKGWPIPPRGAHAVIRDHHGGMLHSVAPDAAFEPRLVAEAWPGTEPAPTDELLPVSTAIVAVPASLPLRSPGRFILYPPTGRFAGRAGFYRQDGADWEWIRTSRDSASGEWIAESRRLGTFALFADTLGPRLLPLKPARRVAHGPYSRWALETRVTEQGSGVDARASYFFVDGRRVPTEWDPENGMLRWRPLRRPKRGTHRFEVVAGDRAGNLGRSAGSFVLD
jgi:hypothetical protein